MAYSPDTGEQFGRYRIVRRLGRGGMGSVYEARDDGLGRTVALKIPAQDLADDPSFRARFLREARILASLDSPHVIQVYEQGDHDGRLYIATQLVRGSDLQQMLVAGGPLPVSEALELVAQVAGGLADAHAAGLLHRDVKPSNVLVRTAHHETFAYLCDFGIALQHEVEHTRTVGLIGTIDYMAPERHEGHEASAASDIYSLGCLLAAALTGRAPFAGTSPVRVAMGHLNDPVPTFDAAGPARAEINQILQTAMAKDPTRRYHSAAQMRAALTYAAHLTQQHDDGRVPVDDRMDDDLAGDTVREFREDAGPLTVQSPHPPAPTIPPEVTAPPLARTGRGVLWWAAGAAAAVLVLAGVGGYGIASRSGGSDPDALTDPAASFTPTAATTAVASGAASTTPSGTSSVTCWDGSAASRQKDCSTPTGRAGMSTVFPSLAGDSTCQSNSDPMSAKAEVWECDHGSYLIRYSRWQPRKDRKTYYSDQTGTSPRDWHIDKRYAGNQWSLEDAGSVQPYQWIGSYKFAPFSVSVNATSRAARTTGMQNLQLTAPDDIGLLP